jgi:hypothetical protein
MEAFTNYGYKGKELRELNKCRIHLQVTFLLDITDGQGRKIRQSIQVGTRDKITPYTFTNWPRQPVPNQSPKQLWKKALSRCFLQGRTNILRTQLGKWTKPTPTLPYYDPTTQITFYYKEEQQAWQSLHNLPRQLGQPLTWIQLPLLSTTPFASHRALGTTETHGTSNMPGARPQLLPMTPVDADPFDDIKGNTQRLAHSLTTGRAKSITDGSFKDNFGTAAFRFWNEQGDQFTALHITPGTPSTQGPYRSDSLKIDNCFLHEDMGES